MTLCGIMAQLSFMCFKWVTWVSSGYSVISCTVWGSIAVEFKPDLDNLLYLSILKQIVCLARMSPICPSDLALAPFYTTI